MCREVVLDYVDPGEGVCYRLLRSVSCLQQLHHPNIVPLALINLEPARNQLRLLYQDAGQPLEEQLKHGALPLAQARDVLRQILVALAHCHCQGITHRNLKPKYVLLRRRPTPAGSTSSASSIAPSSTPAARTPAAGAGGSTAGAASASAPMSSSAGGGGGAAAAVGASHASHGCEGEWQVKLSDFNSVRWLGIQHRGGDEPLYGAAQVAGACSPTVVTQPYRAPEILLGCTSYNTSIDVWACGCVFAEMCSSSILFAGDSDIGQLIKIFDLLGTPGPDKPVSWRGVEGLPYYNPMFPAMHPKSFATHPATSDLAKCPAAADLLRRMLQFDPDQRITAAEALDHPFFLPDSPGREIGEIAPPPPSALTHTPPPAEPERLPTGGRTSPASGGPGQVGLARSGNGGDDGTQWPPAHSALGGDGGGVGGGAAGASSAAAPPPPPPVPSNLLTPAASSSVLSRASPYAPEPFPSGLPSMVRGGAQGAADSAVRTRARPSVWEMWRNIESTQRGGGSGGGGRHPSGRGSPFSSTELLQYGEHREVALQWIMRSALEFCKCDRTVHLAVAVLDHMCCLRPLPSSAPALADGTGSWVELLGIAALLLACKFQEVEIHMVDEFVYHASARCAPLLPLPPTPYCPSPHPHEPPPCAHVARVRACGSYESADVLEAEVRICSALRLDFAIPSSLDFLYCLLHRLVWPRAFAVHRGLDKQVVMLAHLLCELALLSTSLAAGHKSSLVAASGLCLSLACLRCGVWRDGSPGPSMAPEQYWTAAMAQVTGYTRADLRTCLPQLHAVHEQAHPALCAPLVGVPAEQWGRWGVLRLKFAQSRFLGVLQVPPFAPHAGGSLYSPLHVDLVRAPTAPTGSPLVVPQL